jgi:type IV secretion system protein VirB10
MKFRTFLFITLAASALMAEDPAASPFTVQPGTRIPLSMINSVNTKNSAEGDRVYLQTVFPILANGKIVIPPGSYVEGTVTEVKRPGRVKGKGELFLRFDSLTLPNGVTRDFRSRVGAIDGRADEKLMRTEGKIQSEGNKAGDVQTVGVAAASGASLGAIIGASSSRAGLGAGIGGAAGAAAGLMGVLLTRGPEATLPKGSTIEMLLDRPLSFSEQEIDFRSSPPATNFSDGSGPAANQKNSGAWRRFPL